MPRLTYNCINCKKQFKSKSNVNVCRNCYHIKEPCKGIIELSDGTFAHCKKQFCSRNHKIKLYKEYDEFHTFCEDYLLYYKSQYYMIPDGKFASYNNSNKLTKDMIVDPDEIESIFMCRELVYDMINTENSSN